MRNGRAPGDRTLKGGHALTGVAFVAVAGLLLAACGASMTAPPSSPAASVTPAATPSASAPSASIETTLPGPNGRIVFSRSTPDRQDDHTFIANPDGSGVRELLSGFTSSRPYWSPDGRQVAVVSGLGTPCPPTCTGNTVIIDPESGSYRVLTSKGFPAVATFCSIWSPDASHFVCEGSNDANERVNGLYLIRAADGGGLTRLTNARGMHDTPIAYSPDGRQVVFGRDDTGNCSARSAIYVVNVDGSGLRRITPLGLCDDDGSWSPDGSRIVFASQAGVIYTVHPDGTGLAALPLATSFHALAGDVAWSPDGRQIVFALATAQGTGNTNEGVATANADGTNVRQITLSPTFDHSLDWGTTPAIP